MNTTNNDTQTQPHTRSTQRQSENRVPCSIASTNYVQGTVLVPVLTDIYSLWANDLLLDLCSLSCTLGDGSIAGAIEWIEG